MSRVADITAKAASKSAVALPPQAQASTVGQLMAKAKAAAKSHTLFAFSPALPLTKGLTVGAMPNKTQGVALTSIADETVAQTPDGWVATTQGGIPLNHRVVVPAFSVPGVVMLGNPGMSTCIVNATNTAERTSPSGHPHVLWSRIASNTEWTVVSCQQHSPHL